MISKLACTKVFIIRCRFLFNQARLTAAREDWRREMAQSTQVEIGIALSNAREAWASSHKDELEKRANEVEQSLREEFQGKHDEEKRQLVDATLKDAQAQFRAEKRKLEDELKRRKVSQIFFAKSMAQSET